MLPSLAHRPPPNPYFHEPQYQYPQQQHQQQHQHSQQSYTDFLGDYPPVGLSTGSHHQDYVVPVGQVPHAAQKGSYGPPGMQDPEHFLRRKTPNGTLAAGYDGTPSGWDSRPHVSKHVLLPVPNGSQGRGYEQPELHQPRPTPGFGAAEVAQKWRQGPPVIDSVLNQVPMHQGPVYYWPGTHLPSALQPPYQPTLGPTVSNGHGPYGPYWPDGAFVPYRPAARRDVRFHPPFRDRQGLSNGSGPLGPPSAPFVHDHEWTSMTRPPPMDMQQDYADVEMPLAGPTELQTSSRPFNDVRTFHAYDNHVPTAQMHQTPVPLREPSHLAGQSVYPQNHDRYRHHHEQRRASTLRPPCEWQPSSFPADQQFNLGASTGQSHFKDTVLSWAHRVYVDLLASVHQSRKKALENGQTSSAHATQPKLNIWPRPPRQPLANFSEGSSTSSGLSPGVDSFPSQTQPPRGLHFDQSTPRHRRQSFLDRVNGNTKPPFHRPTSFDSFVGPGNVRGGFDNRPAQSAMIYPSPEATSPRTNAMAALELISKLCAESGWSWVDGMLLGGCLAYGLGDYLDAVTWYSKLLDIDSNHVEAISNLAATLLSLNRREEAEQYWLRSVKLRPSYFEAVEHLIGLLCGDHRSNEAVLIIEFVQRALLSGSGPGGSWTPGAHNDSLSETSQSPSVTVSETASDAFHFDYDGEDTSTVDGEGKESAAGFGSSGYAIPGSENGRILALVHAKGNMLYALGQNARAAEAFEDAVLIGTGRRVNGIRGLIKHVLGVVTAEGGSSARASEQQSGDPILLAPEKALQTSKLSFPHRGELPGLREVAVGMAKKAAIATTSNSLLSLAKIFQDRMSSGANGGVKTAFGVRDILALYYLSLSLQPSPSTANNVGILLASVQQTGNGSKQLPPSASTSQVPAIPGVVPGSGIALALAYYNYGLNLDAHHAHLFTNLGSLLKDIGQLSAAIKMYEQAVACDGTFDIALANLANAVKDQGKISEAIGYYRRAVQTSPDFAEAVCGLANALNSVCAWSGRGGVIHDTPLHDKWHVDENGMLVDASVSGTTSTGWIRRVVDIVSKQLREGDAWGKDCLQGETTARLLSQLELADFGTQWSSARRDKIMNALCAWAGRPGEGAKVVRLVERAVKRMTWHWYRGRTGSVVEEVGGPTGQGVRGIKRPELPPTLSVPSAPTVLPFHTFTCPLSAGQIRQISQRNGQRISCSTLTSSWLPSCAYPPPPPPKPDLHVGYVSSDFNNHPLAHLMQSVFGMHDQRRVKAYCYATTASDGLEHRAQIEREAPVFHDASGWSAEKLVRQIVADGIHILVNLNGYTRGARNEVFAARPAPVQMSFMGFAGTLGAEWCDYILADDTAIPPSTLRPGRRNVDIEDLVDEDDGGGGGGGGEGGGGSGGGGYGGDWVYSENIIFARDTFFCCDHRQSAPDSQGERVSWETEQTRRWEMRKQLFPSLDDDCVILGNFNQLYKIDPTTFRSWLRILAQSPRAVLWLLRFPELGEANLRSTALAWAGGDVAGRILFTDVAPKQVHIARARVCDLFLDTPECNAHTTAADVLWSGTPLLTLPRYAYKMCSRMAASILKGALPKTEQGRRVVAELVAVDEADYERKARDLIAGGVAGSDEAPGGENMPASQVGRLVQLRRLLWESRWTSPLFDTRRWVRDVEEAYEIAWGRWVDGEGGDIWL